jgi:sulfite exporter TauE/SafE
MIAALTGMIAGAVHVWAGPDHLAAVAPLAVRRPRRSWVDGVRWGFGHSAGVAVVGLLSLWVRDQLPLNLLSTWGERLVGVVLFGIGLWAWRKAMRNKIHAHEHEHAGERHIHVHAHPYRLPHEHAEAHHHTHAAFGIGLLHGLAGSSHLLGVLPALGFPTKLEAVVYLAAFGGATIISMAMFSWAMGLLASGCASRGARVYRGLMGCCAVMAMIMGCSWLIISFK